MGLGPPLFQQGVDTGALPAPPMDVLSEAEVHMRILRDGFRIPVPLQRTDSLGDLLLDLEEPDPEYHC